MKKALLLMAVVAFLASCKKDKKVVPVSGLFGKWELASISGGWSQPAKVPAGNGDIYQFNRDSTYIRYLDGKMQKQGKFSINITERRDTLAFGTIKFTNPDYSDAWTETPNTITIGTSIADGPSYGYRKVN
ncbi:hypothetical protein DYU05_17515 [Mucilaginibacter terrenus]|uniref:Lipocalin-like domain-containing protein n=1 Tax=Mucilaginibacter terrenus TaxID=2482727 RepID=A0A3E2NKU9_9SPHI|nr:hypothetical protein [Mucilaginibacter terrenus]RFZ81627.1 hypothetical protein DYU05_17515 [Mucilaginibacter terrenus]